jgi:hypothetical protein
MRLTDTPPPGWDDRIVFPLQSVGFATAARALGHRPLFAEDERGIALVLVRRVPIPTLAALTGRAKLYAHARDASFVPALIDRLGRYGVSHVKLGDSMWVGSGAPLEATPGVRRVPYHSFVLDLRGGDDAVLGRAGGALRRHVRRAAARVTVRDVRTPADLHDYMTLTLQTGRRMRGRDQAAVYPVAYFEAIVRDMVPRRQAVLLVARAGHTPLAGALFLTTPDRFVHVHGCSTRDRALTPLQGPTAVYWHAIRLACARGCAALDLGAVTPTEDRGHPHYSVYQYKAGWGGRLVEVAGAEIVLCRWKYRLQGAVLAPMWGRMHPLYLRLFGERGRQAAPGAAAVEDPAAGRSGEEPRP